MSKIEGQPSMPYLNLYELFNSLSDDCKSHWMAMSDRQKEKRVSEVIIACMMSGDGLLRKIIKPGEVS